MNIFRAFKKTATFYLYGYDEKYTLKFTDANSNSYVATKTIENDLIRYNHYIFGELSDTPTEFCKRIMKYGCWVDRENYIKPVSIKIIKKDVIKKIATIEIDYYFKTPTIEWIKENYATYHVTDIKRIN